MISCRRNPAILQIVETEGNYHLSFDDSKRSNCWSSDWNYYSYWKYQMKTNSNDLPLDCSLLNCLQECLLWKRTYIWIRRFMFQAEFLGIDKLVWGHRVPKLYWFSLCFASVLNIFQDLSESLRYILAKDILWNFHNLSVLHR